MPEFLNPNQARFIEFLRQSGIRQEGQESQYRLIDDSYSSYYYNFGLIGNSQDFETLGLCYATKIHEDIGIDNFDSLYGPAMKGISIVIATSVALLQHFGVDKSFFFDRPGGIKEYGVHDLLLGIPPSEGNRVLILDDVFTHGTAKYNALELVMTQTKGIPMGVLSGIDRSEHSGSIQRFTQETDLPVWFIVSDDQVTTYNSTTPAA